MHENKHKITLKMYYFLSHDCISQTADPYESWTGCDNTHLGPSNPKKNIRQNEGQHPIFVFP